MSVGIAGCFDSLQLMAFTSHRAQSPCGAAIALRSSRVSGEAFGDAASKP